MAPARRPPFLPLAHSFPLINIILLCPTLCPLQLWPEVMAVLAEGETLANPWQQDPADADVAPLSPGWKVVVGGYAGYEAVRQIVQVRL
mgnify:CR=1 FL=1